MELRPQAAHGEERDGPHTIMGTPDANQLVMIRMRATGHYRVSWFPPRSRVVVDRFQPTSFYAVINAFHFQSGYRLHFAHAAWAVIVDATTEAAKKTLGKLTQRSKVHVSEYAALAECYIRIAVESDNIEEARAWLQRIEEVHPDYHALGSIRRAVAQLTAPRGIGGLTKKAQFLGGIRGLGRRWRE
jgi:hypothetical protein